MWEVWKGMCDGVHVRKKAKEARRASRGKGIWPCIYTHPHAVEKQTSKRARGLGLFMTLRSMTSRYASLVAPSAGCDPCLAHDDNSQSLRKSFPSSVLFKPLGRRFLKQLQKTLSRVEVDPGVRSASSGSALVFHALGA